MALRLLSQREHSRAELASKLLRRAIAQRASAAEADTEAGDGCPCTDVQLDVDRVLDELQRHGWLDDRRAAEAVARARCDRYGSRRIGQLMRQRQFDPDLIDQVLASTRCDERARALSLWHSRFGQFATEPRERARQLRFLISRGFAPGIAADLVLRGTGNGGEAPDDGSEPKVRTSTNPKATARS